MSDQQCNQPFTPPSTGNPQDPPHVLEAKAKEVADDAKNALIMAIIGMSCFGFVLGFIAFRKAIIGIFCFGIVLGFIAFRKASSALQTIGMYQVAADKRGIATAAKVLGIVDIVLWAIGLVLRIAVLR